MIGLLICLSCGWKSAAIIFLSMIVHDFCDLPLHNDDAHRHFLPFSHYRFISPVSYWDPKYYGQFVAFGELSLVLALTSLAVPILSTSVAKIIVFIINVLYVAAYLRFYIF